MINSEAAEVQIHEQQVIEDNELCVSTKKNLTVDESPEGAPPRKKTMFNYFNKIEIKFATKPNTQTDNRILGNNLHLGPDQILAPSWNQNTIEQFKSSAEFDQFERILNNDVDNNDDTVTYCNYLESIRNKTYTPFKIPRELKDPKKARKYLHFYEDVRPPYGGTWSKESFEVNGRRPLGKELQYLNYEVDSEAEWDVGGPGESLKGDDSEEEEEQDDYEIDMKTFVPHGYVSDDEINCPSDDEDKLNNSLEESFNNNRTSNDNNNSCNQQNTDDDNSVQIVSEVNTTSTPSNNTNSQNNSATINTTNSGQPQQQATSCQQNGNKQHRRKTDINPYVIGPTFEDKPTVDECKLNFLKKFQGVLC